MHSLFKGVGENAINEYYFYEKHRRHYSLNVTILQNMQTSFGMLTGF